MKYLGVIMLSISLVACEVLKESSGPTDAAIKQIKLNHQRRLQQTAVEKSAAILAAEKRRDQNPDSAEEWYNLGMAYWNDYQQKQRQFVHEQALKSFTKVLTLVPGNLSTIKALYNIYYHDTTLGKEGAYAQAQSYFKQLSNEHQQTLNPPSLAQYIFLYYQSRKQDKWDDQYMQQMLLRAMQEQPSTEIAYIQLANLYSKQGYFPLALATLRLGIEQNSQSKDLLKTLAQTYESRASANGCHYDHRQWIEKANRYYLQAISLQPDTAELHMNLARTFLDRNLVQLAAHETDLVLLLKPDFSHYAFAAHNYALMGQLKKANKYLDSAKTAGLPASDSAYFEIYMISGEWLKAALGFTDYIQTQKRIHVYDAIKADIISQQSHVKLSSLIRKRQITYANDWQSLLYAWWQGKISLNKLELLASNQCEQTEIYFYAGYRAMQSGDVEKARSLLEKTLEQQTYRFIERPLAKEFLAKLK